MEIQKKLDELKQIHKKQFLYGSASALAAWDQQVYLPEKGINARAEISSFLQSQIFELQTSDRLREIIESIEKDDEFEGITKEEKAIVRESKRGYLKLKIIPPELFKRYVEGGVIGQKKWEAARKASDFRIFPARA